MSKFKQLVTTLEKKGASPTVAKKEAGAIGIARYGKKVMEQKATAGRAKKC